MENFDVGGSLKMQAYLNNQNLSTDDLNFLETMKFRDLMSEEEYNDVNKKVTRYKELETSQLESPSAENSTEMQELAQDIMYQTGKSANSINMHDFKTNTDVMNILAESNVRSKNDLFVDIDYDDYSSSSDFVKCKIVSHNTPYAYGISAGAKMAVTKSGKIITTRSALYMK